MHGVLSNSLAYIAIHLSAAVVSAATSDLFGVEIALLLGAVWAARSWTSFGDKFFERLEAWGSRFAERKFIAPLTLTVAVIFVRLAMLPIDPVPHPRVVDEFSHLLLADTLAHGRLTNPSHPLWHSFETIHEIQQPTYNSMYFPGPALLLCLGQVLTGIPWIGNLIGTAVLCGLISWALRAWFPARWALLGGILAALHIGLVSYWMDGYWGGTFAALGGTLLLGAFGRLEKMRSFGGAGVAYALVMALGIGMLANSRPYEGLALCVPVAVRFVTWLWEKSALIGPKLFRVAAPMALCLALAAAGMATYFKAVTGSPARLPYAVNQERYGWPVTLPWMEINYVRQDRPEFADYYLYEVSNELHFASLAPFVAWEAIALQQDWRFYFGPALTIPCLFLARVWKKRQLQLPLLGGAVVIFASYLTAHFPHYLSPALLPVSIVWVQGIRYLRQGSARELGVRLSRVIPVVLVAVIGLRLAAKPLHVPYEKYAGFNSWCCSNDGPVNQDAVARRLPPGRHLLLVRYRPSHSGVEQWVYNGADIDAARVVWARELGGDQNRKLIDYYRDRQVWIVEPDLIPARITPYQPPLENLLSTSATVTRGEKR